MLTSIIVSQKKENIWNKIYLVGDFPKGCSILSYRCVYRTQYTDFKKHILKFKLIWGYAIILINTREELVNEEMQFIIVFQFLEYVSFSFPGNNMRYFMVCFERRAWFLVLPFCFSCHVSVIKYPLS